MKTIVAGGAGFIGSAVLFHIINNINDNVSVVDCLRQTGNLDSLASVYRNSRLKVEEMNICNRKEIERIFRENKSILVMHLAVESHFVR